MARTRFSDEEKEFRALLRKGICKPRLARWFQDAGLSNMEKDILYRIYIKGHSREAIAREMYCHEVTITRRTVTAIRKLMDYFKFVGMEELKNIQ